LARAWLCRVYLWTVSAGRLQTVMLKGLTGGQCTGRPHWSFTAASHRQGIGSVPDEQENTFMKIISRTAVRITAVAVAAVVAGGGANFAYASSSDAKPKAPTTTPSTGTITRGQANQMMNGMLRSIPPRDRAAAQRMHREMLPMMTGTGVGVGMAPGSGDSMMGTSGTDGSGMHG